MNLLALSTSGYRNNGSLGFAINGFDTVIVCQPWHENCVESDFDFTSPELIASLLLFLNEVFLELRASVYVRIVLESHPPIHSGFGSGTSLKLSIIDAILLVNNIYLERKEKVKLSRRGGTSGVGVNTYFDGGFITDVGVKNTREKLLPSSSHEGGDFLKPTVIVREKMPPWFIGVFVPNGTVGLSGKKKFSFLMIIRPSCNIA